MRKERLLDRLRNRLRRPPAKQRERIGAALHDLTKYFLQDRDELRDPNTAARKLFLIRRDLCAVEPDRARVSRHIESFADLVAPNPALAIRATKLDNAVKGWLGP